jgi:diguanylate cyclase (GGDEF)-like protein
MQRSKDRSPGAELPESSLGRDLLEQITRPSERILDSSLDLIDAADEGINEALRHPRDELEDPLTGTRHLDGARATVGRTDPGTGLADLPLLLDRLDKALTRRRGADGEVLAIHIELNNLSYVQDQLGEGAANAILKEIAHRLLSHLRNEDTVARVAPSELIVGVSLHDEADVALLTDRLRASVKIPIVLPDRAVHMWTSFTSIEATRTESAADVLKRLDEAIRLQSPGRSPSWARSLKER